MAGGFSEQGEGKAMGSLNGLPLRFTMGLELAAREAGKLLVRTTHDGMQKSGGGRIYSGMPRQSSRAGAYPAVQSAQLLGSMDFEVHGHSLEFGSRGAFSPKGFDYAIAQSQGTVKMGRRPYLELTVDKTKAQVEHMLGSIVWSKIIGGASGVEGPVKP